MGPRSAFGQAVDHLQATLKDPSLAEADITTASDALVTQHRRTVPLGTRRSEGSFFTSAALASDLLAKDDLHLPGPAGVVDPACGLGDLLIAAAAQLPTQDNAGETLIEWGARLRGRDVNAEYVRATRLRLAALAITRTQSSAADIIDQLPDVLPGIDTGDGLDMVIESGSLVALNPPFGPMNGSYPWATGRISRAAAFFSDLVDRTPKGTSMRAILPDVLRTGSNYARWRDHIDARMQIDSVTPAGQFNRWTDVDVFILRGRTADSAETTAWWPSATTHEDGATVGSLFDVRVGTVVPHRDPATGPQRPLLHARELAPGGEYAGGAPLIRHGGRSFTPPFVAVRRTSRPEAGKVRAVATLVNANIDVFVENHLLVCTPKDKTLDSCIALMRALRDEGVTHWLNERLRCRHLTVTALREVPLTQTTLATPVVRADIVRAAGAES